MKIEYTKALMNNGNVDVDSIAWAHDKDAQQLKKDIMDGLDLPWIDVQTHVPDIGDEVWTIVDGHAEQVINFQKRVKSKRSDRIFWESDCSRMPEIKVTHWIPENYRDIMKEIDYANIADEIEKNDKFIKQYIKFREEVSYIPRMI